MTAVLLTASKTLPLACAWTFMDKFGMMIDATKLYILMLV